MFWLGQLGLVILIGAATATVLAPGKQSERMRRILAGTAAAGGLLAVIVLVVAFVAEDWRFAYTVAHARPGIAWPLQVAGLWAGPEGSLLLWTTMLAAATAICSLLATTAWATRLLALISAGYGVALLTVSFPFERLPAPPGGGNGLQPVLEHPAMLWHPPILYTGLIALLIPVAWVVGAAIESRFPLADDSVASIPHATGSALALALAILTAGLATGANWAYVELGWGGYWAWDPIENAGLVAWLGGASMLHRFDQSGPTGPRHRATQPSTSVVLPATSAVWTAAATGAAVIWATTITRTGVLNSVHSFSDQPGLRAVLLAIAVVFTLVVIGGALSGSNSPPSKRGRTHAPGRSRIAAGVTLSATIVVAVGTYEPAIEAAVRSNPFVLSGRFYTVLLWPVAVVGTGARVWSMVAAQHRSTVAFIAAAAGAVGAMLVVGSRVGIFGLVLAAAGGAVAGGSLIAGGRTTQSGLASRVTHFGLGLLLVGIAGTTASTRTTVVALTGQAAETAVGTVIHRGVELESRRGTNHAVATLELTSDDGSEVQRFHPRLVSYARTGGSSAEVDTDRSWLTDTQVVLIDADAQQATYRISRHPRISLVWLGSVVSVLGLALSARPATPPTGATVQKPGPSPRKMRPVPTD